MGVEFMSSYTCNWAAEQIIITIIIVCRIKGEKVAMRIVKGRLPHGSFSLKMTASKKTMTCLIGLLSVCLQVRA